MGTHCTSCQSLNKEITKDNKISTMSFKLVYPIGKGGFGKVWKVIHKTSRGIYAMKEISKVKLYLKKSITLINEELLILKSIRNFFISNLHFAFQNEEYLFLVYDYFPGGDLRYHINNKHNKRFNIEEIKFILACIIIALIYLRQNNIIHRDIKPENLVFDSKGYLHLTDFGISKYITDPHKGIIDKSGTIGYASPETIMGLNHSFTSDYFSLGVIAYELLMGRRPFKGNNKQYIKEQLLTKSIKLKIKDIPNDLNINNSEKNDLCGLINKLLHRKNSRRLGVNNINEIIYHPFFKGLNWNALLHQEMKSPFHIKQNEQVHMSSSNIDNVNIDEYWDILNKINNKKCFAKFYFNSKHKNEIVSPLNKNTDLNQSVLSLSGYSCFTPSNLKTYKRNSGMSSLSTKCD